MKTELKDNCMLIKYYLLSLPRDICIRGMLHCPRLLMRLCLECLSMDLELRNLQAIHQMSKLLTWKFFVLLQSIYGWKITLSSVSGCFSHWDFWLVQRYGLCRNPQVWSFTFNYKFSIFFNAYLCTWAKDYLGMTLSFSRLIHL